jgi:hypothetical protein
VKVLSLTLSSKRFDLQRKYFIVALYFFIGLLLATNLFAIYCEMILHRQFSFAWLFYFDRRLNLPFFFSLLLLLINLFLLYKILGRKMLSRSQFVFWITLLLIFFIFTLDEAFYIHQHFKMSTFGTIASYDQKSWTHYLWVIPYFVVFGFLIGVLLKYSADIANELKKKLVIAAFVFLFGAVVLEFVGTYYAVIRPGMNIYILLIKTAEGVLQLVGSVMFADVFLSNKEVTRIWK